MSNSLILCCNIHFNQSSCCKQSLFKLCRPSVVLDLLSSSTVVVVLAVRRWESPIDEQGQLIKNKDQPKEGTLKCLLFSYLEKPHINQNSVYSSPDDLELDIPNHP